MPGKRAPESQRREEIMNAAFRVAVRQRLAGLTSRGVAAEAGVSNGLIFFHFGNREELLLALLDWLLTETVLEALDTRTSELEKDPAERMLSVVRDAIRRLPGQRSRLELFFEYWFMAARDRDIRRRMRAALKRYRDTYVPLARAVVASDPPRYRGVPAASLASVVAGFIEGCALQAVMDPKGFSVEDYCEAVKALVVRGA